MCPYRTLADVHGRSTENLLALSLSLSTPSPTGQPLPLLTDRLCTYWCADDRVGAGLLAWVIVVSTLPLSCLAERPRVSLSGAHDIRSAHDMETPGNSTTAENDDVFAFPRSTMVIIVGCFVGLGINVLVVFCLCNRRTGLLRERKEAQPRPRVRWTDSDCRSLEVEFFCEVLRWRVFWVFPSKLRQSRWCWRCGWSCRATCEPDLGIRPVVCLCTCKVSCGRRICKSLDELSH